MFTDMHMTSYVYIFFFDFSKKYIHGAFIIYFYFVFPEFDEK